MNLKEEVESINNEIIEWRRDFHKHPELPFEEERTSNIVENLLTEWGLETERMARTGVIGLLEGEEEGKTIAIRADMDALPITEKNDVEYKSQEEGKMHACGHDAHTAMALGAAKVLSKYRHLLSGNVKFIFQPAEEGAGGAEPLIEEGVLNNPTVDAIFGMHVAPEVPSGKIGLKPGPIMASADDFKLTIKGHGTHGAQPHEGVDPITIGSNIIMSLQQLISREIKALKSAVLSIGAFKSGDACNIIPDRAEILGTLRTLDPELRCYLKDRIEEVIENVTQAMKADYELEYICQMPVTSSDPEFIEMIKEVNENMNPGSNFMIDEPSMGSEDFGYFLEEVSGAYVLLGIRNNFV